MYLWPVKKALRYAKIRYNNHPIKKSPNGKEYSFIHIIKTGGVSIGKALGFPHRTHLTVVETIECVGLKAWESAYTFTFVRNPWGKVYSHYKYAVARNDYNLASQRIEFNEWVKKMYLHPVHPYYHDKPQLYLPQIDILKNKDGVIDIDFIGRFEDLEGDFAHISRELGITTRLPHENRSVKSVYSSAYSPEAREIIADWFHEDIEYFGYSF